MASTGSVAAFGFAAAAGGVPGHATGSRGVFGFSANAGTVLGGGGLTYNANRNQDWLPGDRQPIGYLVLGGRQVPVLLDITWYRFFRQIANVTLGGVTAPTVADLGTNVEGAKDAATTAQGQAATSYQAARIVADAVNVLQNVVGRSDSENVAKSLNPVQIPPFPGGG